MPPKKPKFPSELRYDIVSKEWVIIATSRARRPETFKRERREVRSLAKSQCSFCNISATDKPVLVYGNGEDWTTIVITNKYPALFPAGKVSARSEGKFFKTLQGVGFHEVVLTRDHTKHLAQFSVELVKEVVDAYQKRYLALKKEKFVNYISIFHNHGKEAGASVSHPHSQILTTPLIDVSLQRALSTSKKYFTETKKCLYCELNRWEQKTKKRLVFENKNFIVVCPFASKAAFEIVISPKKHLPYFEQISEAEKQDLAQALLAALNKLYKGLNDPAYNFYLHTAPCDGKKYPYYHWHWTILPKTATPAGFEFCTGIEISTIEPEKAAEYLRKIKN